MFFRDRNYCCATCIHASIQDLFVLKNFRYLFNFLISIRASAVLHCILAKQSHSRRNNESRSHFEPRFDVFEFSLSLSLSLTPRKDVVLRTTMEPAHPVQQLRLVSVSGQPWSRGYDVLVINLFCALPATRRAETSFLRRIGLPRGTT